MTSVKPNWFAAKCRWCGERVPPRGGTVKNVVRHKACKGPGKKNPR